MLSAEHLALVRRIVSEAVPEARAYVFGSRATGRARPFSDLDILFVQPARLGWAQRADLLERFEASELPFRVDVVDDEGLAPGMRDRVEAERLPL